MTTARRVPRARITVPGDRRGWIVSAALFAPLVLLLIVAARTWRAELRYAKVTERVIHDYAGIAAWQYARRANMVLHDEARRAFKGIAPGHQRTGTVSPILSPTRILASASAGDSIPRAQARFVFSYDAGARVLETAGASVDEQTRAMLLRRLMRLAETAHADAEPHRVIFDSSGAAAHAIALWMVFVPDRPLRAVYGVALDTGEILLRLRQVIREGNLLPATNPDRRLVETGIALRLSRRDSGTLLATEQPLGSTAATDSTGLQGGELRATVDLSPQLADALLVGGAPPSQLPSLALMIVVATVLAALGLVQQRRSRELARLRGRFVANVSHELRTPLAQISMFAETLVLRRERSAAEGNEFARIIFTEARRLTGLVESVLRFSRIESGRDVLRLETADAGGEVADAVVAFTPIAEAADVAVDVSCPEDAFARLDRAAFRQVMLNLLDNAVKHGGRNATVHVSIERHLENVRISIDDSGPGVPAEWRDRVFEPFVRIEEGGVPGAGIGLSVVRDLVVAHGGRVTVEESSQGGARFVVTVPADVQMPVVAEPESDPVGAPT